MKNNRIEFHDGGIIKRVNDLRKKNPHLSILISVGGGSDGSSKYSEMARDPAKRRTFIHSVVDFLSSHSLNGMDLDWEFPTMAGNDAGDRHEGRLEDKHDYVTLLKELKEAFHPHNYILSAALTSGKWSIDRAYDIAGVSRYLDYILLMTYDYKGPWSHKTGHNAPLYPNPADSLEDRQSTTQFTIEYFIKGGADPKKIILGVPLYGYGWTVASGDTRIGAPAVKGIELGTYGEICQMVKKPGYQVHWDDHAQVPYAIHGNTFITYDNLRSVQKKLDFVLNHHLGGAMVWEVNGDDFHNHCGDGKFPNMKLMMKVLNHVAVHD